MADTPEGLPARRQWGRLAIGLSIALLGAWLFAALYLTAGSRESVVVLRRNVQAFQVLTADDLTTERVAAGERVETIPGDQLDNLIDATMGVTAPAGTMLTTGHIVEDEYELIGEGNAKTGFYLSRDEVPAGLRAGDPIQVVISAAQGEEGDTEEEVVCGGAALVGRLDERTGNRKVDVIVPADDAGRIQNASQDDRVSVARRSSRSDVEGCEATAAGWGDGSGGGDDGDSSEGTDTGTTEGTGDEEES